MILHLDLTRLGYDDLYDLRIDVPLNRLDEWVEWNEYHEEWEFFEPIMGAHLTVLETKDERFYSHTVENGEPAETFWFPDDQEIIEAVKAALLNELNDPFNGVAEYVVGVSDRPWQEIMEREVC